MSAISNNGSTNAPPASSNAISAITSGEFLEIIFAELANQDPLSPTDTNALLEQLGTIRSIESDISLTESLETLVKQNELAAAGGLVGKYVNGLTTSGLRAEGIVVSVRSTREGAVLNLSTNQTLAFDRVEDIIDPAFIQSISGNGQ
ncbi:MAG: flagellar hook capping FlgD N-terminal domain-containing protein [Phycisphaerales bacterium]